MSAGAPAAAPSPLQAAIDRGGIAPIQVAVVALCAFVAAAEGIDLTLIPLLATPIAADLGLDNPTIGAVLSAGPIGLIVGGLGVGWLSDRVGRRWALVGAMTIMTLSTAATAWAADLPQLMACRILTGIGFGGVVPVTTTLVSEFLPARHRASVVSLVIVGQVVGGLLCSFLMTTPLGDAPWRTLILGAAALCAGSTLLILAALPESPRYLSLQTPGGARLEKTLRLLRITEALPPAAAEGSAHKASLPDLFTGGRAAGTLLLWLVFIGICAPVSFLTSWVPRIAGEVGRSPDAGDWAYFAYWAGGILGGLVLPLFCRRWSVEKVLAAAILGAAAGCASFGRALELSDPAAFAAAFVTGTFVSGAFYLMVPPAVRFYPTAIRSSGVGAAVAFGRFGNMASPVAAGVLIGSGQTPTVVFLAMAAPLLLSFAALLVFDRVSAPAPGAQPAAA